MDDEVKVRQEVPSHGNRKTKQGECTKTEMEAHDEELMVYARWDVNYAGRYMLSHRCHRTTCYVSGVCEECELITQDPSFQQAVRRVSGNYIC